MYISFVVIVFHMTMSISPLGVLLLCVAVGKRTKHALFLIKSLECCFYDNLRPVDVCGRGEIKRISGKHIFVVGVSVMFILLCGPCP